VDGALRAVSADDGAFAFETAALKIVVVRASLPGFEPFEQAVETKAGLRLDIVLGVGRIEDHVLVEASPPPPGVERPLPLTPIQTYRTPGAQGDLFRALQALPGVAAPDEAAGLFVRGGDVSEVLVTLDGGTIAHPYRYETPTGGFRGAIDPFQITGLTFSTGGFGAQYGNALSAVVDMRGLDTPAEPEAAVTLGLAGVSAQAGTRLGRAAGARVALNRTLTSVLFAVNGSPRHFDPPPEGWDGSVSLGWTAGGAGRFKAIAIVQRDSVGVQIEQDAFVGLLESSADHGFGGLQWDARVRGWNASASWAIDRYRRGTATGVLDLAITDRSQSWRLDLERTGPRVAWHGGLNGSHAGTAISGRVPVAGGDLGGVSGATAFDADVDDWFAGAFLESTLTAGRLSTSLGVRTDRFGRPQQTTVDPRVNVRIALGGSHSLRLATGLYRQAPAAGYYDSERGAGRLPVMEASHVVAGYERGGAHESLHVRIEAYHKKYRRLPLEQAGSGYTPDGSGSAAGLDAFVQWTANGVEVRAAGSLLRARRRWTPLDQRERYALPDAAWRPDFEIPWSAQMLVNVPLGRGVGAGASWRVAAGRPNTPIVGAIAGARGYTPVFGAINSERFPRYERLDVSVSWLLPAAGGTAILFASFDNVLGRRNFFEYSYAPDYSSRRPVVSAAPRSFYAGVTLRR
jgi:hypothetical protein